MKVRILVLNSDSLAALSVTDERLSHGFKHHTNINSITDFILSSKFNTLLSLPADLSQHINLQDEVFSNCEFYSIDNEANFDCAYVKEHFDVIFFFLHDNLEANLRLNESVLNLLSDPKGPDFFIFNLQISKTTWEAYQLEPYNYQYRAFNYFFQQVLPLAKLVTISNNQEQYANKEQYLKFYHQLNLAEPNFHETLNAYSLFEPIKTAQSLINSFKVLTEHKNFHPHNIVLNSALFNHHLVFGMSPYGAKLLKQVHDLFPQANLILVLDKSFYSYINSFKKLPSELLAKSSISGSALSYQLGNSAVAYLNEVVANLIKVELFKEQDNLPPFPESLDGSFYDHDLNESLKEYSSLLQQAFICVDYSDFAKLNADLVISDNCYTLRVALAHGIACLPLSNDIDQSLEVSYEDFAVFDASKLDFLDLLLPQASMFYPKLKEQGLMNYCPAVGHYGAQNNHALLEQGLIPSLSLTKVLSSSLSKELELIDPVSPMDESLNELKHHSSVLISKLAEFIESKAEQDSALNKVAQLSNYTNSQRYQLQWQFLQYLSSKRNSLKILSFGCSRGQELCDLTCLFEDQLITGVDINYDVLAAAKQLQSNLKTSTAQEPQGYTKVSYLGSSAYWRLMHSSQLELSEQFDIVCAMTVLCRHPETVGIANSSEVYPFEDFNKLLTIIDSLVKQDGLLCLYNANYRLEDSALSDKYVKVFPCNSEELDNMPNHLKALYESSTLSEKIGYVSKFAPNGEPLNASELASIGTIFLKVSL